MQHVSEAALFEAMQSAVKIVHTSAHPTNKVAASLIGHDRQGRPYCTSRINDWPPAIAAHLSQDQKIGDSSGTVHAETACILASPYSYGASLCITDPFCPNCAKNMAEAGIAAIYIDHKGFNKDFARRRGHHFEAMSMEICARAGIAIYEIKRKQEIITPILEISPDYTPPLDTPAALEPSGDRTFESFIAEQHAMHGRAKFACARIRDGQDNYYLGTGFHPVIGYTSTDADDLYRIANPPGKYSFIQEPVNRLLMTLARHGLTLEEDSLYCARVPTARELVNCVGAGLTQITIGDRWSARDDHALQALDQLESAGVLRVIDE
jgi:dCMP deaminase